MTVTTLDPKTALIVIDLQKGIVAYETVPPTSQSVQQSSLLLDAFRSRNLPVVLVNVTGGAPGRVDQIRPFNSPADWAELVPELKQQSSDHLVTKKTWGAFTNTDLEAHLKDLGVTQVVLAGVATSVGVESTARHAHELGFHVTFAVDAMTDMNPAAHANSIERMFPRLGESGTTAEIIAQLNQTHPL